MSYRCDLRDELAGPSGSAIFSTQVLRLSDHAKRPSKRDGDTAPFQAGCHWTAATKMRPRFVPVLP